MQWRYIFHNRGKSLLQELAQKTPVATDSVLVESPEQNNSRFIILVHNIYLVLLRNYHVKGKKEADSQQRI